jgi:aspartate oxidase
MAPFSHHTIYDHIFRGYAADFSAGGLLAVHRPDLLPLSTTNGDHATGDGLRLVSSLPHPAGLCDLALVQVHPTGFVDPANTDAKTKFLAAEALRSVGGLIIDAEGNRFVNEVDRRDAVTEKMEAVVREGRGPVRLVLNIEAVKEIQSHCKFLNDLAFLLLIASSRQLLCIERVDEAVSQCKGFRGNV